MRIGVPKERRTGETRVAATPETVARLVAAGHELLVEAGAGQAASQLDAAYEAAGARIASTREVFAAALLLKVRPPAGDELAALGPDSTVVGMLNPFDGGSLSRLAATGATGFALEAAPRITRAHRLDVLSSQATVAGYKAVLLAANLSQRLLPMLMTAAGTIKPARVLVLGAGVAGLQAIATARRLGAVVEASDSRPAVREQVESLGATFIDVPYENDEERRTAAGTNSHARAMPETWMKRQADAVARQIVHADIVITTAQIPGRRAPILVTEGMVRSMQAGAVIVDLAVEQGGNCPLSEVDSIINRHGVTIAGVTNLAGLVAADSSALYARNVLDFLSLILDASGQLQIDSDNPIVEACLVVRDGKVLTR